MKRSRRQILKLLAAGSAAALAAPAAALAETATPPRPGRERPQPVAPAGPGARTPVSSTAVGAEIAKQKRDLAAALKTLRDYKLPAGSPLAFNFRPLRAPRRSS